VTDPKRWSDEGGAETLEEQLLVRAGQDISMPEELKTAVWSQITAAIASPLLTSPAAIKALSSVAILVGTSAAIYYTAKSNPGNVPIVATVQSTPSATSTTPPPDVEQQSTMPEEPPNTTKALEPRNTDSEQPTASPSVNHLTVASRASQLQEETKAVLAARQALRSNDATKALRLLEQARQKFRNGVLTEEREALTIDALARSGNRSRAEERAKAFLIAHPRSPHASDVQRYVNQ
jgi:hypothetical protein